MVKKFDYCISNPPYQTAGIGASTNGSNAADNIFHYFYKCALDISKTTTMIFPGGRWMQRQSKCREISNIIIPTVNKIWWYPNGDETNIVPVFEGVKISDGVSIVLTDEVIQPEIYVNDVKQLRPQDDEIIPLYNAELVAKLHDFDKVSKRKLVRKFFGIQSYFVERNTDKVLDINNIKDSNTQYVKAWLANEKPGSSKRVKEYWLRKDAVEWTLAREKVYQQYKVYVIQAAASKRPELGHYLVVDKNTVVGESWLMVGLFDSKIEALNYRNYIDTRFSRNLLAASKGGNIGKWGYFVPDLEDYTNNNDLFKDNEELGKDHTYYGLSLEERLHKFFNLTEEEIAIVSK